MVKNKKMKELIFPQKGLNKIFFRIYITLVNMIILPIILVSIGYGFYDAFVSEYSYDTWFKVDVISTKKNLESTYLNALSKIDTVDNHGDLTQEQYRRAQELIKQGHTADYAYEQVISQQQNLTQEEKQSAQNLLDSGVSEVRVASFLNERRAEDRQDLTFSELKTYNELLQMGYDSFSAKKEVLQTRTVNGVASLYDKYINYVIAHNDTNLAENLKKSKSETLRKDFFLKLLSLFSYVLVGILTYLFFRTGLYRIILFVAYGNEKDTK